MTLLGVIIVSWLFVTGGWVGDGRRLNGWTDGRKGGRMDGRKDGGWMDGQKDGWTDG